MTTIEFYHPDPYVFESVLRSWNVNITFVDECTVRGKVEGFIVGESLENEVIYVSPVAVVHEGHNSELEIKRIEVVNENYYPF